MAETNGNGLDSGRNALGRFTRGHKSLGGRKRGSRNLLSESFLADLHKEWKRSGPKVLQRVSEQHPETFLRVVGQVLPRVMEFDGVMNVTHRNELAVEVKNFVQAYEAWGRAIGVQQMPMIEAEVVEVEADEQSDNG